MPSKRRLALADDDELLSEVLAGWLEQRGYDVLRFASGDALVSWASDQDGRVDAILLDVDMPGRDGFESCRTLRGLPLYAATPTVFVSSMEGDAMAERASAAGGSGFIRKDAALLATLASWLSSTVPV